MIESSLFCAEEIYPRAWKITNTFNDKTRMNTYTFLVEGDDRALIIDTMFGWGNLKSFCREITSKPLSVVFTHFHGDHTGGIFDFDECYIHEDDIVDLYLSAWGVPHMNRYAKMEAAALPDFKDRINPDDISREHGVKVIPLRDGDMFDLGGKKIEVIHVGGHSKGCIALLDRSARAVYTGDCCNNNTLLVGDTCLSVEEHLEFLRHFKNFQPDFDIMYGAHDILPPCTIDEGIELCGKVIAGTDDHEAKLLMGRPCFYGIALGDITRMDGMPYNIAYAPQNIHRLANRISVFPIKKESKQ